MPPIRELDASRTNYSNPLSSLIASLVCPKAGLSRLVAEHKARAWLNSLTVKTPDASFSMAACTLAHHCRRFVYGDRECMPHMIEGNTNRCSNSTV